MRGRLGALHERPFRLLWLGKTGSAVGDALIPVALTFAVLDEGDAADLGLVLASFTISRVVFIVAGGVWSDRLERRMVMLACDLVRAAAQAALAALILAGSVELWHFLVISFVVGGASAFFGPASTGLVPQTVSAARLQQANALLSISDSATGLFGPAVSGVLVATAGPGIVFAVDAASYLVSAVFLTALELSHEPLPERQSFLGDLAHGLRVIRERTWLWAAFVTFAISNFSIATYFVLGPLVVDDELGGAADWGLILTGGAFGGVVGGALALRWKPRRPLLVGFLVVLLVSVQLLALVEPFPVPALMLAAALAVAGIALANALWDTVLQQHVPREAISRVSSVDWSISLVFMPVGFTIAGPIAAAIGVDATLLAAAAIGAAANLGVLLVPSVRNLERRDAAQDATPAEATA